MSGEVYEGGVDTDELFSIHSTGTGFLATTPLNEGGNDAYRKS